MHRKAFAISVFLFLLMMGAIAFSNYNRDWKQYQRQYYYELNHLEQQTDQTAPPQSMSFLDSVLASILGATNNVVNVVETELQLKMEKVVTDPGRTADMCMTCHINQGADGFDEEPLVDLLAVHPQYVLDNYPFDTYGCTACHGGQPLSLDVHHAHEALTDTIEDFFMLKVSELTAPNWIIRQKAIERIRWVTGDDFGYAHDADPELIAAAQERIMEWWELHKATFYTEGFGDRESPFKTENPLAEEIREDPNLSPTGKPLAYVNNNSCIGCHNALYDGRLREAQAAGSEDSIQAIRSQLDHIRLWTDIDLSDITLADDAFGDLASNYTCQMCHGPGEEYFQLMQKGYSLELQGRSIEASDLLGKASEIARVNARHNLSDPNIWALFQAMARKMSGMQATEMTTPESESSASSDAGEANPPSADAGEDAVDTSTEASTEASTTEGSTDAGESNSSEASNASEGQVNEVLIAQGQQLSSGCVGCHTTDGTAVVGPSWLGLYGRTVTLDDGSTQIADEDYIKKSITNPEAEIVQGYANIMPPYTFDDEQLAAIIAYIKSLSN